MDEIMAFMKQIQFYYRLHECKLHNFSESVI